VKTIITLDKANQPYGFPQLNGNGHFDNIIVDGGLSATTISATTYQNLPTNSFTGGTVNGTTNFTNGLSANTFSATTLYGDGSNLTGISGGGSFSGGTISGSTTFTNGLTANTISATTYQNLPISGLTAGSNINISGTNNNFTISVTGITSGGSSFTGGTVSGSTTFTNGLSANTFSATTLYGDGSNLTGVGASSFSGGTINGKTTFTNGVSANTISASTIDMCSTNGTLYTSSISGCSPINILSEVNINNGLTATTISASTIYGDGSNLTNVGGSSYIYEIGQYVSSEGGIIFNRWLSLSALGSPSTGTVQNYLVVDIYDAGGANLWATTGVSISNVSSSWDGSGNTENLILAGPASGIGASTAADLCYNRTSGGKSDWYLPAIDELNILYNNRWFVEQGIVESGGSSLYGSKEFWSSTQSANSSLQAGSISFLTGVPSLKSKITTGYVRAIRKFSI
jgi:hypothetical protein